MFNTSSSNVSQQLPSIDSRTSTIPPSVRPSLQLSQIQIEVHPVLVRYTPNPSNMSTNNVIPSPSSPSEAEIITFKAHISISVSLWEPEVIDLTADDSHELSNEDSTSATMLEPNSDRVMLYTEPEDEASAKSESWSPTEVDSDFAMGYFAPDLELGEDDMFEEYNVSDTASLTEPTPSEYATAINCFGPAPPKNYSSMQPESEPCSPTEVDYDFAMG